MTLRRSRLILASSAIILGALVFARADNEKIAFPENYTNGVRWSVVEKPQLKRILEYYAMPEASEAARKNQPMPYGTILVGVQYDMKLDPQGNPERGPDGRYVRTNIRGYTVMEKRSGWGAGYTPELRNGEWEYQLFKPDKTASTEIKTTVCLECHKPFGHQDYVQGYDQLRSTPGSAR
jgi:hypothetical protein